MPTLLRLHEQFSSCSWLLVYTLEAHAIDEWPISSSRADPSGMPVQIKKHRTLQDRLHAARGFQEVYKVPFPVVADTIEDVFEFHFCTWPFRFYVLQEGRVVFQAQPQDCSYRLEPLVRVLQELTSAQ